MDPIVCENDRLVMDRSCRLVVTSMVSSRVPRSPGSDTEPSER